MVGILCMATDDFFVFQWCTFLGLLVASLNALLSFGHTLGELVFFSDDVFIVFFGPCYEKSAFPSGIVLCPRLTWLV